MNKEFIPYEQALELKQLGFNEPCFGEWQNLKIGKNLVVDEEDKIYDVPVLGADIKAPTYSQAFRWFREKYGWYQTIDTYFDENNVLKEHGWHIYQDGNDRTENYLRMLDSSQKQQVEDTYEEAEISCLKKLIEIVKNK